jgi:hypothetical protein
MDTFSPLNELGTRLERRERAGATLYVWQQDGTYHLPGERYDDVIKSACGKTSGRVGLYGVTDSVAAMTLCPECATLEG